MRTYLAIEDDDLRGGAVDIGGEALSFAPFEVTVLPEPLTMALMGAGGVIIARKRRV